MRSTPGMLALLMFVGPAALYAQSSGNRPVSSGLEALYGITKQHVTATAEQVPENLFSFQPTEEVRTLGQILAHIANSQFFFCSAAAGERSPQTENLEETRTTKAQIQAALRESFAYCDGVYSRMTDARAAEMRPDFFTGPMSAAGILAFNAAHNYEHYGNLVTYMRINGITPPSSQGGM